MNGPIEQYGRDLADAGRKLLEAGLVARTWGNLSIRVDETHFLITPSGRNYETLLPEDMSLVNLDDLSWEGRFKPSSEKELHARVYRCRPEVNSIIHTHQPAASSPAAAHRGFVPEAGNQREKIGAKVPIVPYALPTTASLARAVEKVARSSDCRAMLLSNHGALCIGPDLHAALTLSVDLEAAAESHVLGEFRRLSGDASDGRMAMLDFYVRALPNPKLVPAAMTPQADRLRHAGRLTEYLKARFVGKVILHHRSEWIEAAAARGEKILPLLDDLAQLIGPDLPVCDPAGRGGYRRIRRILRRRSAVLLPGIGCLCAADTSDDAAAVALVADKGCRVSIESAFLGGGKPISRIESRLMRFIYLMKYSRKAA